MRLVIGTVIGGITTISRFVINLLSANVKRTDTRTGSFYATDAVIADGETTGTVPEDVQALAGYRLATTVADGAVLGAELTTNGDFTSDTDWTKGDGWSIAGGRAIRVASASFSNLVSDSTPLVVGVLYRITIDVIELSSGPLKIFCGTGTSAEATSTGLQQVFDLVCSGSPSAIIQATSAGTETIIDNVSYKQVIPTWYTTDADGFQLPDLRGLSVGISGQNSATDDDKWTEPTPSVLTPQKGAIEMVVDPSAALQTTSNLLASRIDSTNHTEIRTNSAGTGIILGKLITGALVFRLFTYTHTPGTLLRVQAYWDNVLGMGIRVADADSDISLVSFIVNSDTQDAPLDSSITIGSINNAQFFQGTYKAPIFYTSKEAAGW